MRMGRLTGLWVALAVAVILLIGYFTIGNDRPTVTTSGSQEQAVDADAPEEVEDQPPSAEGDMQDP